MWQMGGFGPMLGQSHHFNRFAKETIPYAIQRYNDETKRLWGVLNTHLAGHEFIVDQELSIADFAIYPWATRFEWQGIQLDHFPHAQAWMARMSHIEFVQRGMAVP
jgi:GST-like protein